MALSHLQAGPKAGRARALGRPFRRALEAKSFWTYLRAVVDRLPLIALITALGLALGGLAAWLREPVYEARASLEIRALNESFLDIDKASPTSLEGGYSPRAEMQTRVRVLRSASLAEAAGATLLAARPEWRTPERAASFARMAEGVEVRASDDSRIVDIVCRGADPDTVAGFANALAAEFIGRERKARVDAAEQTQAWLTEQLAEAAERLDASERELHAFARRSGLSLGAPEQRAANADGLRRVRQEMLAARAERMRLEARAAQAGDGGVEALSAADAASLAGYERAVADLRRKRAELDSLYTPRHYLVEQTVAELAEADEALARERSRLLGRVQAEFESAGRRERLLADEYAAQTATARGQAEAAVGYEALKREADANRELYTTYFERVKQAGLAATIPAAGVRALDSARAPRRPISPPPALSVLAGGVLACFGAVLFVVAREQGDRTVKSPGEIAARTGLQELGAFPDARVERKRRMTPAAVASAFVSEDAETACWLRRPSWLAESMRVIRTSVLSAGPNAAPPRVVVVTSPGTEEGKTTIAANLAASLAELGERTLLIDADLRNPRLHEVYGVENRAGLFDLLLPGEPNLQAPPLQSLLEGDALWIMTAGVAPGGGPGILHTQETARLLGRLSEEFDVIVVDAPPVLPVSDARRLAQIADATVLVARASMTDPEELLEAEGLLRADGAHVAGTVLNRWDAERFGRRRFRRYVRAGYAPPGGSGKRLGAAA